jgi:16S rRNA C967 or C1407 C5-methylase (RsmB/RsmF family)
LCASPGGKTLAMLQTMLPSTGLNCNTKTKKKINISIFQIGKITCRDISSSRIDRLNRMLRSYIDEATLNKKINIEMNSPGFGIPKKADLYDKVLVDVPCTNDRASLFKDKNNIFSKYRVDERTEIPQTQANLLR